MFAFLFVAATQTVLTVFAAASLSLVFPELGRRFEQLHPGVTIRLDFDGSQILEAQLAQGAQADVFASADQRWMDKAASDGLVEPAVPFATNSLVVVASDRSSVQAVHDLAAPGLRLVVCADAVPCGRYARTMIARLDADPAFGKSFDAAVLRNVVSEEQNVEGVLAKVTLGEADAGIVYRSDAAHAAAHVRIVALPATYQPAIVYPIATLKRSAAAGAAHEFVAFVRSAAGQDILRHFGFASAH